MRLEGIHSADSWGLLLDAMPLGAAVYRADGELLRANDRFGAAEELLEQDWRSSEAWRSLGLFEAARIALADDETRTLEQPFRTREGKLVWMHLSFSTMRLQGEGHLLVLAWDTTAQMEAEEELRSAEAFHLDLLQRQGEALGVVDADEIFLFTNPLAEQIFGVGPGELVGRSLLDFVPPVELDRLREETRLRAQGVDSTYEMQIRRPEGEIRHIMVTATRRTVNAEAPLQIIGLFRDITEQKQVEAERVALERQVQHAQKMESLGHLAGGVAHDINNVLGAILGLAEVHRMDASPGSPLERGLETIIRACSRGGSLVRRLLGFARQRLPEEHDLDLNMLVQDQIALLERTTLHRVKLLADLCPGALPIRGDASALSHALVNLCVNALDAMEPGGTLTIRTREIEGEALLEVTDTGCGMSPELQEKVFDPFFTTKGDRGGTGLGLSLVFSTVKAHRGRIELQSLVGEGTTVSIRLPKVEFEVSPETATAQAEAEAGARNLLVIEDDELVREMMSQLLESLGHCAILSDSGEGGLGFLAGGLEVDAVILDINMPGLGGKATLQKLRETYPELPVFLVTGRADQQALELAQSHAHVHLLAKPFGRDDLGSALRTTLRAEVPR